MQSARPRYKQSPTGVSDLRGRQDRVQSARTFYTFDASSRQTPNTRSLGPVVAGERAGAGRRAVGRAGGFEPGIGCGKRFLNRLAFPRGKQAENCDFREGGTREGRLKVPLFPTFSPFLVSPGSSGPWSGEGVPRALPRVGLWRRLRGEVQIIVASKPTLRAGVGHGSIITGGGVADASGWFKGGSFYDTLIAQHIC